MKALAQKAEHLLELPQGSLSGEAHLDIDGRRYLAVTGECEIREYEDTVVRLMTRSGEVRISGNALTLEAVRPDGVSVCGQLLSVEFI